MKFQDGYPVDEIISGEDIVEANRLSNVALSAAYQERVHEFRADVMLLILKHNAYNPESSWLIFDHADESEEGPVLLCPRKDVCVAMRHVQTMREGKVQTKQHIRVMVNEVFSFEDGQEFIVTDAVVDAEDDAQYYVGPFPQRSTSSYEGVQTLLFYNNEGSLGLVSPTTISIFPPIVEIKDKVGDCQDKTVIPFGHYNTYEDKLHALNVAAAIVASVKSRIPLYQSKSIG